MAVSVVRACAVCCVLLAVGVVAENVTDVDVSISSVPGAIHEGFTKSLDVNCTFDHRTNSEFTKILSLILSKTSNPYTNDYQELASLTEFSNDKVDVTDDLGSIVTGHLEPNSISYIAYQWRYPTSTVEGKYKCEAYGMDGRGHPKMADAAVTVQERAVNMEMVLVNMKKMDIELDELLTFKQQMTSRLYNSMMALVESQTSFNGKSYWVSKPMAKNVAVHQSLCQLYGGQLAELESQDEMTFVMNFLKPYNESIALGGSDAGHEGQWNWMAGSGDINAVDNTNNAPGRDCLFMETNQSSSRFYADECYALDLDRFVCEM